MTDDPIRFLTDRLNEDAADADARRFHDSFKCDLLDLVDAGVCSCGYHKRVLAEVEAKRRLLAEHKSVKFTDISLDIVDADVCRKCHSVLDAPDDDELDLWGYPNVQDPYPCNTVKIMLAVFQDHPDFQPEWKLR